MFRVLQAANLRGTSTGTKEAKRSGNSGSRQQLQRGVATAGIQVERITMAAAAAAAAASEGMTRITLSFMLSMLSDNYQGEFCVSSAVFRAHGARPVESDLKSFFSGLGDR